MKKSKRKFSVVPYLYIAPSFLIYLIFVLIPILSSIVLSFTNYNLRKNKFVGLNNYIRIFKDEVFLKALANTFIYSVFVVSINLALGLVIAYIVNDKWFRGSKFCRTVFYMPYIISPIAASMIWIYMYDSKVGVLNAVLRALGLSTQAWLLDEKLAMPCLIFMGIWQGMGYCLVVYFAALQSIPRYLYEAAEIDGASKVKQLFRITIPMLSSTTFFLLVMTTIASFQVFAQIMVMTGGGPINRTTTIAHQIYMNAFQKYLMGYATSQAVILFVIVLILTLLFFRFGNKEGDAELD